MNTRVKQQVIDLALATPDQEVCGFIVHGRNMSKVVPCNNVSIHDRAHTFEISEQDYISATKEGVLCGVYHSHPTGPAAFSETDIETAEELELPMFVVALTDAAPQWLSYVPSTYRLDETGAEFAWGFRDCYETIRIHYRQQLNIHLPDYDRDDSFRALQSSAIMDNVIHAGFQLLPNNLSFLQKHDVLVFNNDNRRFPHHLAVFVGQSRMLHHPFGRLSCVDNIGPRWLDKLVGIGRYVPGDECIDKESVFHE